MIADLLAASPADGTAVGLQCKPISSTGSDPTYGSYFVMAEDSAPDTLKVYYSTSASTTDRVNDVTGQISTEGTNRVLCVDGGPGFDRQGYIGHVQTASAGTIAWAKTFPDGTELPQPITGVITTVSETDPILGKIAYIQSEDRSSGMMIDGCAAPGEIVRVIGTVTISDTGEKMIANSVAIPTGIGKLTQPVGMNNPPSEADHSTTILPDSQTVLTSPHSLIHMLS